MFHKRPKQQQTPGIFRQMFHKKAKIATFAGEKTPANVPKNGKLARVYRFSLLAQRDDLPERIERSARRQLGAPSLLRVESTGVLSTHARSAFVSIDEGRADSCGCVLETGLCFVCAPTCLSA